MRFRQLIPITLLAVLLGGCSVLEISTVLGERAPQVGAAAESGVAVGESVLAAIDDSAPGAISADSAERVESGAGTTASVAGGVARVAGVIAAVPGPQQPVAGAVAAVAGAVAGVAGAIGAALERRRRRQTERALDTALIAGVDSGGYGAEIVKASALTGTSDLIADRYTKSGAAAMNKD